MAKKKKSTSVPVTISELSPDEINPRSITNKAASGLTYSMNEYGDLSGIVFNIRTKNLVAGHQRIDQIFKQFGPLPINQVTDEQGVIECPNGNSFFVRFVNWDLKKQRAANVAANSPTIQGDFTDELQIVLLDIQESDTNSFEAMSLDVLLDLDDDADGQVKQIEVKAPPAMTWCLIGIATNDFGTIADTIQSVSELNEVISCEVTACDD